MGIATRLKNLLKADDEYAVVKMIEGLITVQQTYAEVIASTKCMEYRIKLAEAEGAKWYKRAELALTEGEEELARQALARYAQLLEESNSLKEQVKSLQKGSVLLYERLKEIEAKIVEAGAKEDLIITSASHAKAFTEVKDMLAQMSTGSSVAAFDRMSEKAEQLEEKADVSKQWSPSRIDGQRV